MNMNRLLFLFLLVFASPVLGQVAKPNGSLDQWEPAVAKIIEVGRKDNHAYHKLIELCDDIGHRVSGSESLLKATEWAKITLAKDGHVNSQTELVMVEHWVRGEESCELLEPRAKPLSMLGLGRSIGTAPQGIEAEVVVVDSKEELDGLNESDVKGKIVVFNATMPQYSDEKGAGYGETVKYRTFGASWAAERGAVAALVRSVTAYSLSSPHTGAMVYTDPEKKVPAAAISVEDAMMLRRFQDRGIPTRVRLKMDAHSEGEKPSANVLAEIVGSEKPDEIVVIGGHIDSWDVGQGAQDDGSGCVAAMEALRLIRVAGLKPRRTIRVVLWTDEEQGGAGARYYAARHQQEKHIAGIESDSGGFVPKGLSLEMQDAASENRASVQVEQILSLMSPLGRMEMKQGYSGADVSKLKSTGTCCMGLNVDGRLYFNTHHTNADTVDKVNPQELGDCATVLAIAAYLLADMETPIGSE